MGHPLSSQYIPPSSSISFPSTTHSTRLPSSQNLPSVPLFSCCHQCIDQALAPCYNGLSNEGQAPNMAHSNRWPTSPPNFCPWCPNERYSLGLLAWLLSFPAPSAVVNVSICQHRENPAALRFSYHLSPLLSEAIVFCSVSRKKEDSIQTKTSETGIFWFKHGAFENNYSCMVHFVHRIFYMLLISSCSLCVVFHIRGVAILSMHLFYVKCSELGWTCKRSGLLAKPIYITKDLSQRKCLHLYYFPLLRTVNQILTI